MKFNKIIFATLAASLLVASCDSFDQPAKSEYDDAVVFTSPTLTQHAINSIYDSFTIMSSYRTDWYMYYGANTDVDIWNYSSDSDERNLVCKYDMKPNNSSLDKATYQYFYGGGMQAIERANIVIEGLEQNADLKNDRELRNLYGEALTARAIFYLDMIRYYGEVPARFKPITAETSYVPNVNTDVIFEQILADLEKAAEMMDHTLVTTTVRPTKACAEGMYARIALQAAGYSLRCADDKWNTGDPGTYSLSNDAKLKPAATYETALRLLDDAIKNSGFKLESDFEDIWKFLCNKRFDPGHEMIFQHPFSDSRGQVIYHNGVKNDRTKPWAFKVSNRKGPSPVLYFKYDKDDVRRDISCIPCEYGTDGKGKGNDIKSSKWYFGKYRIEYATEVEYTGTDDGVKFGYLRMADLYLMAAEIANELGQLDRAKEYMRPILERAWKNTPSKVDSYLGGLTNKDEFFEAIKDQRAFEFCGEFLRKGDLTRWGILKDALDQAKAEMDQMKNMKGMFDGYQNTVYWRYKPNGIDIEFWDFKSTANPTVTEPNGGWKEKKNYFSGFDSKVGENLYKKDPIQNMWRPIPSTILISYMGVLVNDFGYSTSSSTEE